MTMNKRLNERNSLKPTKRKKERMKQKRRDKFQTETKMSVLLDKIVEHRIAGSEIPGQVP